MTVFRYEWGKSENKLKSKEMGRPFYEDCIMVRFVKQGGDIVLRADTKAFEDTYLTIRNPSDQDHVASVKGLQAALKEFKDRGEVKVEGTPITEWPMITVAEAENLRVANIQSIEALAAVEDSQLKDLLISREMRNKAREWLEFAADKGAATAKSVEQSERLAEALETIEEQKVRIKALQGTIDTLTVEKAAPADSEAAATVAGKKRGK